MIISDLKSSVRTQKNDQLQVSVGCAKLHRRYTCFYTLYILLDIPKYNLISNVYTIVLYDLLYVSVKQYLIYKVITISFFCITFITGTGLNGVDHMTLPVGYPCHMYNILY